MTRLSAFFKALVLAVVLSMFTLVRPASAQDGALVVVAIELFSAAVAQYFSEILTVDLNLGMGGIRAQVAADTIGVQNALQHHAGATISAVSQQTALLMDQANLFEFGDMGSVRTPRGIVRLNTVAPSGCRRVRVAEMLAAAAPMRERRPQTWKEAAETRTRAVTSAGQAQLRLTETVARQPNQVSLNWMTQPTLTPTQTADAAKSITTILNPLPLPTLPIGETAPAAAEYAAAREILSQRMSVAEDALRHQLEMRAPLCSTAGDPACSSSVMSIINQWRTDTVESVVYPDRVQAKSSATAAREQVFLLSANLYVQTELLSSINNLSAIMAVNTANQLSGLDRAAADALYARAVQAQDRDE